MATLTLPESRIPDPATAPPLRWGIVGPGNIARAFTQTVLSNTGQRIVAAASRSAAKAEEFAAHAGIERAYGSYDQLFADPDVDVVYIATPHSEHHDNALAAIAAGKHVLVEKAFARNASEAREIAAAARAAGVACLEAMWTRFLPHIDILRQLLENGDLGELETVIADHGQRFAPNPQHRLYNPDLAGGALLDLGIYPVSFAHLVLGDPGRVLAAGTTAETGVDAQASMLLGDFPMAPRAQALLSTTLRAKTSTRAMVAGSEACVEIDGPFYAPSQIRLATRDGSTITSPAPRITGHLGLCFEAAHLATLVAEGRTESPLLTLDQSVAIMETLDEVRHQLGVRFPGEDQ